MVPLSLIDFLIGFSGELNTRQLRSLKQFGLIVMISLISGLVMLIADLLRLHGENVTNYL